MTKLFHPHSDIQVEVADADVNDWTDQGWRKSEPAALKSNTPAASGDNK